MTLIQSLRNQNLSIDEIKEILKEMIEDVLNGADVEEILFSYGLEPDYTFDLLILANRYA